MKYLGSHDTIKKWASLTLIPN